MKTNSMKRRILWSIGSLAGLGISYGVSRFVFFGLHGMKSWPNALAIAGLVLLIIALFTDNLNLSLATVIGYIGGFVLALIFNTDGVDQGGTRTNNAWIIWGIVFFVTVLIGIAWDMICTQRKKSKTDK